MDENIIEWLVWGMRMEMVNSKKKHIINKFIYYENISFFRFFWSVDFYGNGWKYTCFSYITKGNIDTQRAAAATTTTIIIRNDNDVRWIGMRIVLICYI